ncbi:MAG: hypothetical protein ACE5I8_10505 [Thermodesulfobacteriota bacterium]
MSKKRYTAEQIIRCSVRWKLSYRGVRRLGTSAGIWGLRGRPTIDGVPSTAG